MENLKDILKDCRSISCVARKIFGNENYYNRIKCKKILEENGINWKDWLDNVNSKPIKYCLYCGKEITSKNAEKFCDNSCAASYNNSKRASNDRFCLNCGKNLKGTKHKRKFCSEECFQEFKYKNLVERWKNGLENGVRGDNCISRFIRKYLFIKYDNKCQLCGWGEENPTTHKIPLQVHHIDGDFTNNKEENLQLLCPNCHSLTETFGSIGGRSSKRVDRRTAYYREEKEKLKSIKDEAKCVVCGKLLNNGQFMFCSNKCHHKYLTKNITKEQILGLFEKDEYMTFEKASKELNLSTTTLRKKILELGIREDIQQLKRRK